MIKKIIITITSVIAIIAIGLFLKWDTVKYSFWTNLAASGWADNEQLEFKLINDKYGEEPGNPMTISLFNNEIGIWVNRIVDGSPELSIGLELYKNIKTKKLRMQAVILNSKDPLDRGVPNIVMRIPFSEFDKILEAWIDKENVDNLITAAKQGNWKTTYEDTAIHYTQIPHLIVEYKHR